MDMQNFGWIEIVFTAVVALGFGAYQLWSVNREIAKDREKAEAERSAAPGHPEGQHELDDGPAETIER